jgi:predicted secreted protein
MKRVVGILFAAAVLLLMAPAAIAGSTDSHTVTVTVDAINEVAISGGNLTLTISTATAGSDPDNAADSTTCDLAWTTNEADKKITVATDLVTQKFTLKVVAENVTGGTATAEVTLSTTATNFVTGIATTTGGCDLAYTASATAAQGTGTDTHTVTYTITNAS